MINQNIIVSKSVFQLYRVGQEKNQSCFRFWNLKFIKTFSIYHHFSSILPSLSSFSLKEKKTEKSPRSTNLGLTDDDHSPRSEIKQTTPSRSRRRDRRPNRYDYDDVIDTRYESDIRMRGNHPSYRGMPNHDPYMQMLPNRFDMRMDPYMMQNTGYGGFPGYNGMMYGPNAGMPRLDRFDDRRQDFGVDREIDRDQYSSKYRKSSNNPPGAYL